MPASFTCSNKFFTVKINFKSTLNWFDKNPERHTKMDKPKMLSICPFSLNPIAGEIYVIG